MNTVRHRDKTRWLAQHRDDLDHRGTDREGALEREDLLPQPFGQKGMEISIGGRLEKAMKQSTTAEVINLGRFTACWADNTLEELQILIAEEAAPGLIDRTLAAFERIAKTMLTLAPLVRRTISPAVCVLLIFMSAAVQAGEPFIVTAKEGILSTTTHGDILTLRLYATENDWRAFNFFYKILVKKHRAGVVAKGTNFFIETYYDDGTVLIHAKGIPYALYIAILPTLDQGDQFQRVQPSPTPSPNPASTPI